MKKKTTVKYGALVSSVFLLSLVNSDPASAYIVVGGFDNNGRLILPANRNYGYNLDNYALPINLPINNYYSNAPLYNANLNNYYSNVIKNNSTVVKPLNTTGLNLNGATSASNVTKSANVSNLNQTYSQPINPSVNSSNLNGTTQASGVIKTNSTVNNVQSYSQPLNFTNVKPLNTTGLNLNGATSASSVTNTNNVTPTYTSPTSNSVNYVNPVSNYIQPVNNVSNLNGVTSASKITNTTVSPNIPTYTQPVNNVTPVYSQPVNNIIPTSNLNGTTQASGVIKSNTNNVVSPVYNQPVNNNVTTPMNTQPINSNVNYNFRNESKNETQHVENRGNENRGGENRGGDND